MSIARKAPVDLPACTRSWEDLVSHLDLGGGLGAGRIDPDKLASVRLR